MKSDRQLRDQICKQLGKGFTFKAPSKRLTMKPIPKYANPTDNFAKHPPMKPIPGWLVMDPEDGPVYIGLADERTLAEMSMAGECGQYLVPVEIRERPKRAKRMENVNAVGQSADYKRVLRDAWGVGECPKSRRAKKVSP